MKSYFLLKSYSYVFTKRGIRGNSHYTYTTITYTFLLHFTENIYDNQRDGIDEFSTVTANQLVWKVQYRYCSKYWMEMHTRKIIMIFLNVNITFSSYKDYCNRAKKKTKAYASELWLYQSNQNIYQVQIKNFKNCGQWQVSNKLPVFKIYTQSLWWIGKQ